MKSTTKKISSSQLEIEFEISWEEFEKFIEKATFELGKNLEIEGFRKGKAPRRVIEEKVGLENILVEAADIAIRENYSKYILENELEPISEPKVDVLKLAPKNPFIFRVKVLLLPEVELPDYKEIAKKVKRRKISVDEKEIAQALEWLRKSRAKFISKNKKAEKGDFVEIEYFQSLSLPAKMGERWKDAFTLGEGHFVAGFEEKLEGMTAGEEKEFSLKFPSSHPAKNLAGKEVYFHVRMINVQEVELPELNDNFAQNVGRFKNLTDLKKSIKEGIVLEKENNETQRVRIEILDKIREKTKIDVPDVLVQNEQGKMLEEFKKYLADNLKISFDEYLKKTRKSEREVKESFLSDARKRVENFLILKAIGEKEKIKVSEEEIKEEINNILKRYPSVEQAEKELDPNKLKAYTKIVIRNEKVFKLLESFVQV